MSSATAPVNLSNPPKKGTSFFGKLSEFVFGPKGETDKVAPTANVEMGGVTVAEPISKNAAAPSESSNNNRRNISAAAGATGAAAPPSPSDPMPNVEKGFTEASAGNSVSVVMPGRGGKRRSRRVARSSRRVARSSRRGSRKSHKARKNTRSRK